MPNKYKIDEGKTKMSEIQIIKRNGNKDTLDLEKLHKVSFYCM